MPASKTKYVKTPKYRESVLSGAIAGLTGQEYGPAWANGAPQGKITKMRDWSASKGKAPVQKFAKGGPVINTKGYKKK